LKQKKKAWKIEIEEMWDERMDSVRHKEKDPDKRRNKIVKLMDDKDQHLAAFEQESKVILKHYMRLFPKLTLIQCYKELLTKSHHFQGFINQVQESFLCDYTLSYFNKKKLEYEDLAPLLYLQITLFGIDVNIKNLISGGFNSPQLAAQLI
jgi:DNA helicase-2/ATP-dependent DNA helicase PcrA